MIRLFLGSRMMRAVGQLDSGSRARLQEKLVAVAGTFGNPRRHSGLGLRKLGPGMWECRLDRALRIILLQDQDGLLVYDVMNHDQIRAWLRKGR